jgi:hypothetical protein
LVPRIKRLCLVFHFFSFTFSQTDGILHQDQELNALSTLCTFIIKPCSDLSQVTRFCPHIHKRRFLLTITVQLQKCISIETHHVSFHAHTSSTTDERFCQLESILTLTIYALWVPH